jgi:hypothetical protein
MSSSKRRCSFNPEHVQLLGDHIPAIMLGQIIYWNTPDEKGNTRLRVTRNNQLWLAKSESDWFHECAFTPAQVQRALRILKRLGIIEVHLWKFNGAPTNHIGFNEDRLRELLDSAPGVDAPTLDNESIHHQQGVDPSPGVGGFTTDDESITEITTVPTTEHTTNTRSPVVSIHKTGHNGNTPQHDRWTPERKARFTTLVKQAYPPYKPGYVVPTMAIKPVFKVLRTPSQAKPFLQAVRNYGTVISRRPSNERFVLSFKRFREEEWEAYVNIDTGAEEAESLNAEIKNVAYV